MGFSVDFTQWGSIYLAPGGETVWWFTWIFDLNHWQRMAAAPDSGQSSVQIVEEWAEKDIYGTTKLWVRFKNNGSTAVIFRPKAIVVPAR